MDNSSQQPLNIDLSKPLTEERAKTMTNANLLTHYNTGVAKIDECKIKIEELYQKMVEWNEKLEKYEHECGCAISEYNNRVNPSNV